MRSFDFAYWNPVTYAVHQSDSPPLGYLSGLGVYVGGSLGVDIETLISQSSNFA